MNLLRPVAETKQKVRNTKIDRIARGIARTVLNHGDDIEGSRIEIRNVKPPPGIRDFVFEKLIRSTVVELLGKNSNQWAYNAEATYLESTSRGGPRTGYGNFHARDYKLEGHTFVFERVLDEPGQILPFERPVQSNSAEQQLAA